MKIIHFAIQKASVFYKNYGFSPKSPEIDPRIGEFPMVIRKS